MYNKVLVQEVCCSTSTKNYSGMHICICIPVCIFFVYAYIQKYTKNMHIQTRFSFLHICNMHIQTKLIYKRFAYFPFVYENMQTMHIQFAYMQTVCIFLSWRRAKTWTYFVGTVKKFFIFYFLIEKVE